MGFIMSAYARRAASSSLLKTPRASSKATKGKIVEKAERLFWFQGYEATSLNDLVEKAGLSKGAFFHYYDSKQAIAGDVIDKYAAEQMKDVLQKHLADGVPVKTSLRNWVGAIFENYKAFKFKGGCLLGNMALELSDANDAAREQIKGHFLEIENILVSALKPLETQGKLSIEARQCARLLMASIQGVTLMTKAHKDSNRAGREFLAVTQLIDVLVRD